MNSWLRLAFYSFIGIVIGSFVLGILVPTNGAGNTMAPMGNFNAGNYETWSMNIMQDRMQYGMGAGMNYNMGMRNGMGMRSGMGMH